MTDSAEADRAGRLTVIVGPMFAGKTTALIERLRAAEGQGRCTLALKSAIDDRYDPEHLVAHTGVRQDARAISLPAELRNVVDAAVEVVGIDEAHFFREGFVPEVLALLDRGVDVICAGLDRTSFHVPFGEMGALCCEADAVLKLTARCTICGGEATHTKRLVEDTRDIVVGGEGMFEPRCRRHRDD
jgi:thymidine kinase